jgi:hypothetical protein
MFYKKQVISTDCIFLEDRDSSVGIATGYRLDGHGSIFSRDKIFLFSIASIPGLGPT